MKSALRFKAGNVVDFRIEPTVPLRKTKTNQMAYYLSGQLLILPYSVFIALHSHSDVRPFEEKQKIDRVGRGCMNERMIHLGFIGVRSCNDLFAFQQRIQTDSLPPLLQQKRISASRVRSLRCWEALKR